MTQAVILAGGKGTRLSSRLAGRPKPLVDVGGRPLLDRQLETLAAYGIDQAIVLVNHAADQIAEFLSSRGGAPNVVLIDDGSPRGTAGAILACLDRLEDEFLVVYGDTLFDVDLSRLLARHRETDADVTLFLHPNDHPQDSDLVEIDASGGITAFHGYPHPEGLELRNLVNAALYVVRRDALVNWKDASVPLDCAKDLFPQMLAAGHRFQGYVSFEYIKDLGTPKRLDKVIRHLETGVVERARLSQPQKAVFLDRDGTLNIPDGYIARASQLDLLPGAADAVAMLNDAEYRAVVITNQPVLARGECDAVELDGIHARLEALLGAGGGFVDGIYYCPHHPDVGFAGEVPALKIKCDCRKPGIELFRRAQADLNIDFGQSWMVGDTTGDMAAAEALGIGSILVRTGDGGRDGKFPTSEALTCDTVLDAARMITIMIPAIEAELDALAQSVAPGSLVLIGGLARSGKSTASIALRRMLQRRGSTRLFPLDRWLKSAEDRIEGVLGRYDLEAAAEALAPWLEGGTASFMAPFYDRFRRTSLMGQQQTLGAEETLILEGVPALSHEWPATRPVVKVWIEAAETERRARVEADLVARGLATDHEAREVAQSRDIDEAPFIVEGAAMADWCIDLTSALGSRS